MVRLPASLPNGATARPPPPKGARERFTFRGNLRETRHGWLRLTPAYSLHLVRELIAARARPDLPVLDPFAGTGTTLLVCAERGIDGVAVDLNPFLRWLAAAKVARYTARDRAAAIDLAAAVTRAARATTSPPPWLPSIHRLDRWWLPARAQALGRARAALEATSAPPRARDLVQLAFCRTLIETANVSFGHQSLSFRAPPARESARRAAETVSAALTSALDSLAAAAAAPLPRATLQTHLDDARTLGTLRSRRFGAIVTSPPYANRMSYVRELRPYLYWLGYLRDPGDAGELDWRAIGGTWGRATSRLGAWTPPRTARSAPPACWIWWPGSRHTTPCSAATSTATSSISTPTLPPPSSASPRVARCTTWSATAPSTT
ncbi:MAG TPA: hypothetical protein PLU22_02860 [Polyangiaceae bacterium]|nr:hypothetical protein [Polyangiaceae bacterium]